MTDVGTDHFLLLSAVLLWTDTIAPRFVGSVLTFTAAAAWCRWLELHPDDSPAQSGADSTDGITGSR